MCRTIKTITNGPLRSMDQSADRCRQEIFMSSLAKVKKSYLQLRFIQVSVVF